MLMTPGVTGVVAPGMLQALLRSSNEDREEGDQDGLERKRQDYQ